MHEHLDHSAQPTRRRAGPTPAGAYSAEPALDPGRMLELQRLAGNARVLRSLQRSEEGTEDDDEG
jgi:hypothetical protein